MRAQQQENTGTGELKALALETMQFGKRCVHAARNWINERSQEMKHQNEGRDGGYGQGQRGNRASSQGGRGEYQDWEGGRGGMSGASGSREQGGYQGGGSSN